MRANMGKAVLAAAAMGCAAWWPGPVSAGEDDVNPVFAEMTELPRAALERASGRGADDESTDGALQSASVAIGDASLAPLEDGTEDGATLQLHLPEITCGECTNDLGSAFSGASAVAAITQNNGSHNAINNLVLVEANMHQ